MHLKYGLHAKESCEPATKAIFSLMYIPIISILRAANLTLCRCVALVPQSNATTMLSCVACVAASRPDCGVPDEFEAPDAVESEVLLMYGLEAYLLFFATRAMLAVAAFLAGRVGPSTSVRSATSY
jgi:hypothetical protein